MKKNADNWHQFFRERKRHEIQRFGLGAAQALYGTASVGGADIPAGFSIGVRGASSRLVSASRVLVFGHLFFVAVLLECETCAD